MTATVKKDKFAELKKVALQIESLEAQTYNTFDVEERGKLRAQVKARWVLIDTLLDKYNDSKRNA